MKKGTGFIIPILFILVFTQCKKAEIIENAAETQTDEASIHKTLSGPSPGVTFFENISYGGVSCIALSPGNYTTSQLNSLGIPDNYVSSVKVPTGYKLTMYQNDNFTGTSWVLNGDTPNFTTLSPSANDQVSSCKVEAAVNVYADTYAGATAALAIGYYTKAQLLALGISDNTLSSAKVPDGLLLTVYDGDNFTGSSWQLTQDKNFASITGLNDVATSVSVRVRDFPANPLAKAGYTVTKDDEFNGSNLDLGLWVPYYLRHRASQDADVAAQYVMRDGCLVLQRVGDGTSSVQTIDRTNWHKNGSRTIPTLINFSQKYGYFEIRAKARKGTGYCSTFWLVGEQNTASETAEVDVLEQPGHYGQFAISSSLHNWGDATLTTLGTGAHGVTPNVTETFNIYGLEWTPTELKFYFNNTLYYTIPQSPQYKMGVLLSFYRATGAWFGTADPADIGETKEFMIDYFRAYSKNP
ncbi:family 16 glycosylhydrolase [Mucilaginibacter terrae]|uniref:family 16 glycosylhydrolase n=1 Tax=Mucilaginibacter terrae TaxID=1955052 RepID=UPI00363A00C9